MDERQTQIRERAGLEESLLNQDFIDWLRKWGTPILMVAALSAVGYTLYLRYQVGQSQRVDKAFAEFELARAGASASPSALAAVATEFEGVRAVSMLARLEAADRYVDAVRRRMKIGAELAVSEQGSPTGALAKPEDALADTDREDYLTQAAALYQRVHDDASTSSGNLLTRVNAMYGLAAVAECRRNWDEAAQWYNRIASLVDGTTYVLHKKVAEQRVKELDELKATPPLPLDAQVPKPPPPPAPPAPAVGDPGATPPATVPPTPPPDQTPPQGEPPPATDGPKR
ncbi:MAG: hypothetical protein IT433_05660 [Phycisphaerales bacterium]|nr:hypothetical protein [Phycisphaerales bacterium]